MVLGLAVGAEPGLLDRTARQLAAVVVAVAVSGGVDGGGHGVALDVAPEGFVAGLGFEVGGGGVEEQQVDLQVEQVRGRGVHVLGQGWFDGQEPVHRPVAGVVADLGQARNVHVTVDPARGGQLRGRCQCTVGDQREQDPFNGGVAAGPAQQGAHRLGDPEPGPQRVQHPGPAQRPGLDEAQPGQPTGLILDLAASRGLAEQPGERTDQPLHRGPVQLLGPAEVVQHLHPRALGGRIPLVVRQLQVPHHGAVLVPPRRRPHEHVTRRYPGNTRLSEPNTPSRVTRHFGMRHHPANR